MLQENNKRFNGTLGMYPHKKVHIDIDPNAKPVNSRPYPVPQIHFKTFKKELNHLARIGVLAAQQESKWASPSFIIPKKDGRVRWFSNLRQLNKVIRCKQYPLPIITDILRKHSGYKFFTKLDVSMQYYTFDLDKESQDLCTIITPFGKYRYLRLPIGLKCSPDIAQAAVENVLSDIKDANVYINDVGAFSNNWDHHVNLLATNLRQLKEYAQVEGVLAEVGVASELAVDLPCGNGEPEAAEYCEKVPRISVRPHVDLVPGRNGTGTHLTCADT